MAVPDPYRAPQWARSPGCSPIEAEATPLERRLTHFGHRIAHWVAALAVCSWSPALVSRGSIASTRRCSSRLLSRSPWCLRVFLRSSLHAGARHRANGLPPGRRTALVFGRGPRVDHRHGHRQDRNPYGKCDDGPVNGLAGPIERCWRWCSRPRPSSMADRVIRSRSGFMARGRAGP